MVSRILSLLLVVSATFSTAAPAEDAKGDLAKIQGRWLVTTLEAGGESVPAERLNKLSVTFAKDRMTLRGSLAAPSGKEPVKPDFTIKLDPTKSPKAIDLTVLNGPEKGKTMLAIYELEGDTLKLCLPNQATKDRPNEFKSPKGSSVGVLTLKRAKK
jgi:RNA polymerase sigma-70 factor (ECF subfamily)